jgi:hypothetical protein
MIANLILGTLVISASVLIHTFGLMTVTSVMERITRALPVHGHPSKAVALIVVVLGIFTVMTVEVWLWAVCHYSLGVVDDFDTALYFSTVTFSTVGFGDVLPHHEWRLFGALEGIDGFLLIGWSTAYLVAAGVRLGPFRSGVHF